MVSGYLSGAEVLQQIRQTHSALGGELQASRGRLDQLERSARDAVRQRGEAVLELAKHYLPELNRETISNSFLEVRHELEDVLEKKQARETELLEQWDRSLDRRAELETSLDKATDELNGLVARREELEEQLGGLLAEDKEFGDLSQRAMASESELARNEARVSDSRKEASDKLPAYKNSRMFQYLLERGYGTAAYKKRGLTRRLDRWVARLVDFNRAKKSYNFLRVTPELMAAEVKRRRSEFDGLMEQVEAIQRRHSDQIGLTETLEQGVEVGQRRDALVTKIDAEQKQRDTVEQQLAKLGSDQSDFYQQAVARMKRFLESLEESSLDSHARQTASRQDDALVAELRRLGEQVEQSQQEISRVRQTLTLGQRKAADLSDLSRHFRANEFDSSRSVFKDGFDARPLLESFLRGQTSKQALWNALRSHQEFLPQWVEQRWDHRGGQSGGVFNNDFSYVLMRVLAEAAGAMIEQSTRQSGRAGGGWGGSFPAPRRRQHSAPPPSVRRPSRGGFTSGRGF